MESKYLKFHSFYHDYNVSVVNCVDLTNAVCLGQNYSELYYYYLFLFAVFSNWSLLENDDDLERKILDFLNINKKIYYVHNFDSIYKIIKDTINDGAYPMLDVKYRSLFYYKNYLNKKEKKYTRLIINGFDASKDIVQIMEMTLSRRTLYSEFTGELFCPLPLTSNILKDIIDKTQEAFLEDKDNKCISIITYDSSQYKKIDFKNLLLLLIDNIESNKDVILTLIDKISKMQDNINFEKIILDNSQSFLILKKCLLKYYDCFGVDSTHYCYIEQELNDIFYERRSIILQLNKIYIRKTFSKVLNDYKLKIKTINLKLLKVLNLYINGINNYSNENLISFDAKISADSELRSAYNLCNNSFFNDTNYWVSVKAGNSHWILVDLKEIKSIKEIIIYHYGSAKFNTLDFSVHVSGDNDTWITLREYIGNIDDVTKITNLDNSVRYIKVVITKTNVTDMYARLRKIEVYS